MERRNKRESSSNTDFKIAIFPIRYLRRFLKGKINRKSKIQERETKDSLGQNRGPLARCKCNIQLIVYHGYDRGGWTFTSVAEAAFCRTAMVPRSGQVSPIRRFHVGTHRCRRFATPLSSSTHLAGPPPNPPPTRERHPRNKSTEPFNCLTSLRLL